MAYFRSCFCPNRLPNRIEITSFLTIRAEFSPPPRPLLHSLHSPLSHAD
jgi:hypothetical protein